MLWATARSVREERSKQRGALQEFSVIRVSMVRGKSGWRIGSVSAHGNAYQESDSRKKRGAVTGVIRLLRKYLHGEENQVKVFSDTEMVIQKIIASQDVEIDFWLAVFSLRLLNNLGYIAPDKSYDHLLESSWPEQVGVLPSAALEATKRAETASHL